VFDALSDNAMHSNKIKHFQKIKDENNFLKKELVGLFNENKRLKQEKGHEESKSKNLKVVEVQFQKVQAKLESKTKELKDTISRVNKL
jgi:hypothetical protein